MSSGALLVLTTCANSEEADNLAAILVEGHLAACVNRIDGVVSTYRWDSKLQRDQETLVLIKTTEERLDEVKTTVKEHASYELPEFIAVPVYGGSSNYLSWLQAAVTNED